MLRGLTFRFLFHRAHSYATFGLRPKGFEDRPDSESGLFLFSSQFITQRKGEGSQEHAVCFLGPSKGVALTPLP